MNKEFAIATVILALLLPMAVEVAVANPLTPPIISVNSPQNNKIYSSNDVQVNFRVLPNSGYNFTSFTYVLDGQAPKATDGTTILTGLSSGSHTLTIYGTGTYRTGNRTYEHNDILVAEVYFNSFFNTISRICNSCNLCYSDNFVSTIQETQTISD